MGRKMRIRVCQICGKQHEVFAHMPDGKLGVFCSSECKSINAERLRGKQCVVCGTSFVAKSLAQADRQKCCSKSCAGQLRSESTKKGQCNTCGKCISHSMKYCSQQCSNDRWFVNVVVFKGKASPVIGGTPVRNGWDNAITMALRRMASRGRNKEGDSQWDKRIRSAMTCLNIRKRREQAGPS